MDVAQQSTLTDIENYLIEVSSSVGSVDLRVPSGLRARGAASEASFAQFLLTWGNISSSRRVRLTGQLPPAQYADRLAERLPGRVAALLCTSARRDRDETDYARELKSRSERLLLETYYNYSLSRSNVSGRTIDVLCADTAGYGEPRTVYQEDATGGLGVKDVYGFLKLSNQAFSALVQDVELRELTIDDTFVKATASLLYELFSNTHDHARSNYDGTPIQSSCRGFQIRVIAAADAALRDAAGGYTPIIEYIESLPATPRRNRQLLEISVYDAGPGFAQQFTKRPLQELSLEREREAVEACFSRGVTTKGHTRYGQGLPQVIALLRSRHGFLRLRTGRLALSRDLSKEAEWMRDRVPEFESWAPANHKSPGVVQGSCLTVLMPIERRAK